MAINVYGWENDKATVLRVSKLPETCKCINLMLLEEDGKTHYCWIKNFNELIRKQRGDNQQFACERCLTVKSSKKLLEEHMGFCKVNEVQRVKYAN